MKLAGRVRQVRAGLVENERKPLLYFHTSNADKYLQARLLADRVGLNLRQFRAGHEPYDEDYQLGSEAMLAAALDQVIERVGRAALVFVEDTSLRIAALSTAEESYPGLAVKEWFTSTSFEELDAQLAAAGGDRRVVVRSDIALHVPGLGTPVYFSGETPGSVALDPPSFLHNEQYPWLTPLTFNGWFVPDGADRVLGALPLEVAETFDFRAKSIQALLRRVEEYTAILNLTSAGFRRRASLRPTEPREEMLPGFTSTGALAQPQVLIVGRTCAGKTTFAEYASMHRGIQHIEASQVLRALPRPTLVDVHSDANPSGYALAVLREHGMDAVARYILENWGADLEDGFVVSGLRTIEEVACFRRALPSVQVVRVDAPESMRFARHLTRKRLGHERNLGQFRARDKQQDDFGLLPVARELAGHFIDNVGTLSEYHRQVDQLLDRLSGGIEARAAGPIDTRLSRALSLLREKGPMYLPNIQLMAGLGQGNASRVLGGAPNTTLREKDETGRETWRVSPSGLAYLEVLGHLPPSDDIPTMAPRKNARHITSRR